MLIPDVGVTKPPVLFIPSYLPGPPNIYCYTVMASPTPSTRLATHLERVDHLVANAETAQQGLKDLERILKEMETSRPPVNQSFITI